MTEETSRRGEFLAAAGLGAVGLGAALATPGEAAAKGAEITFPPASEAVAKFRLTIPAAALVDLRARLRATRFGLRSNRRASTASGRDLTVGLIAEVIS